MRVTKFEILVVAFAILCCVPAQSSHFRKCLANQIALSASPDGDVRLEAYKSLSNQDLVETIAAKMRGLHAQDKYTRIYQQVIDAAVAIRDADYRETGIDSRKAQRTTTWKRLVLVARMIESIERPYFAVNETEMRGYAEAFERFLRSDAPLKESYDQMERDLEMYWKYHRAASLAERMGLQRRGNTLFDDPS